MSTSAPWHKPHPHAVPARSLKQRDPFYGSARWLRFRSWILAHNPLCADPLGYHKEDQQAVPATDVHHLIRWKERPESALSEENAQALCSSCHARISAKERNGRLPSNRAAR